MNEKPERPEFYPTSECDHDYKVLDKDLNVIMFRTDSCSSHFEIDGYVLFHCSKCLDVQKKVIT